jgi:predicted ATPase
MKIWLKTGALLAAVWVVAAIVIHLANASHPTAATVTAYVKSINLDALQGAERERAIERMEKMVNGITFEDRQQLDRERISRDFLHKLTPAEQGAYLDATLPTGFQQLMDSFNKMDPARRKQIVSQALERMKEHQGEGPPPGADATIAQHVIDQGLKSFYRDADADVKLDLAPLVEQMQLNLQHP